MGTPAYLAPEMWRRQPYSYSADVWALGCILYELCALKPLFCGETDREIGRKVGARVQLQPAGDSRRGGCDWRRGGPGQIAEAAQGGRPLRP